MKRPIRPMDDAELLAAYPTRGATPGWFFRTVELSAGVWRVEGCDRYGRQVAREGTDPDLLARQCEADAAAIG